MKQIAAALVKAQKAFGPALKTSTNPHFKSRYADLSACVEAVIDALNDNGIALIQQAHECTNGVIIETVFVHESGEVFSAGKLHVPAIKQDAQGYGSAMTYARRYSLMAACGIAPEDDDGQAASRKASSDYEAFEAKYLPILREAAMKGFANLTQTAGTMPECAHVQTLKTRHGASLKQAAQTFDQQTPKE